MVEVRVPNLDCEGCATKLKKALFKLKGMFARGAALLLLLLLYFLFFTFKLEVKSGDGKEGSGRDGLPSAWTLVNWQ